MTFVVEITETLDPWENYSKHVEIMQGCPIPFDIILSRLVPMSQRYVVKTTRIGIIYYF